MSKEIDLELSSAEMEYLFTIVRADLDYHRQILLSARHVHLWKDAEYRVSRLQPLTDKIQRACMTLNIPVSGQA